MSTSSSPESSPESAAPAYDAAEKGTLDDHSRPSSVTTLALSDQMKLDTPLDAPKEVITIPKPLATKPSTKEKISRWILWQLWFNTYRHVSITSTHLCLFISNIYSRKLFTFVITLNIIGIILAASGHFPYANKYTSAMALGNLNVAILMRNELFGRLLYLFVNTCFAKVPIALYQFPFRILVAYRLSVDAVMVEIRLHICSSGMNSFCALTCVRNLTTFVASRRHSQRLCAFRC